jgi:hypothetical protein
MFVYCWIRKQPYKNPELVTAQFHRHTPDP